MIDWRVLEEEPLPDVEPSPPPSRWARWRGIVLLAVALLVAGGVLRWRVHAAEAQLRADVTAFVMQEEQARRFGLSEQAAELADPNASEAWLAHYYDTFALPADAPVLRVSAVEPMNERALVTLVAEADADPWPELRSYRLTEEGWRRAPVTAAQWGVPLLHESPHFRLWLSERDAARLPPDDLLGSLEVFYGRFVPLWPEIAPDRIALRVEPREGLDGGTLRPTAEGPQITLSSPLLRAPAPLALAPEHSFTLAVGQAVAASFSEGGSMAERQLRSALRDALVRALLLDETERAAFREQVRAEASAEEFSPTFESAAYRVFFGDYLIDEAGLAAPGRFWTAYRASAGDMSVAATAAGLPLPFLEQGAHYWLQTGQRPNRSAWYDEPGAVAVRDR